MTPAASETAAESERFAPGASGPPLRTSGLRRLLPPAVLVGLVIATAAAFAITERLKLEQSPVYGTQISRYIKLRQRDVVTLTIRDARR